MRNGAGASSTSFWCRRCSEQSRVPTTTTLPCVSARTCASTCRGTVKVALHEAFAAAEGCHGFPDGGIEGFLDLVHVPDHLQPAPAAAEGRLDGDRQAVLFGERAGLGGRVHGTVAAGHQRGSGTDGDLAGGDLVAELPDGFRGGADPGQAGVEHGLGEVGVLGQEAVAGVDGVRSGLVPRRRAAWGCSGRCPTGELPSRLKASLAAPTCMASASMSA